MEHLKGCIDEETKRYTNFMYTLWIVAVVFLLIWIVRLPLATLPLPKTGRNKQHGISVFKQVLVLDMVHLVSTYDKIRSPRAIQ